MAEEILKLKKEIERLRKSIKKQRYGLVWMPVPEAFEDDVENKLPILKEVPDLAIKNDDGKPTHILIEGDNYHALTCLNYTHKGKIDVIYIDPPYNTGSDGFRYKDKRIIDKFPDGTEVPVDHPFRHSYWLSFMKKRLELAGDLLKDTGIIFISIDDNELAQLKLLCDEIFLEKNFVAQLIWENREGGGSSDSKHFKIKHEYVLAYAKNKKNLEINSVDIEDQDRYTLEDDYVKERGKYQLVKLNSASIQYSKSLDYPIKAPDGTKIYPSYGKKKACWRWSKNKLEWGLKNDFVVIKKGSNGDWAVYTKQYLFMDSDGDKTERSKRPLGVISSFSTTMANKQLEQMFGKKVFDYSKPYLLIKYLIGRMPNKESTILDFFAGSGTTGHSVIELNDDDDGKRQFILVTNNENNIISEVCYPRIHKVIKGYKSLKKDKIEGLGSSLKYYKTAFIGKNNILNATDADKVELAHNAGGLLAIAENTLELVKQNKYYQLFEEGDKIRYTTVYFREELDKFEEFVEMVEKLKKKTAVYVFTWGNEEFSDEFDHIKDVRVKTIPQPILEIYKNIYNLGA